MIFNQWRSQSKNLEGVKMFDFRRITLFFLEKRLSKNKMAACSKILGGTDPLAPPGYAYVFNLCMTYFIQTKVFSR